MKKYIVIAALAFIPSIASAQTITNSGDGQITVSTTTKSYFSISQSVGEWLKIIDTIIVPNFMIDAKINTPSGKTIDVQKFTDSTGTCYYSEVEQTGQISINCINL